MGWYHVDHFGKGIFDKGGFSRGLRPRKRLPSQGSWLSFARPEGLCRTLRYHALTGTHLPPQKKAAAISR